MKDQATNANGARSPATELGIAELSKEFDVTARTLRFYEEKGLLRPRRSGTTRHYSPADRVRLRLILRGKRLGLSLAESQEIIDLYDAPFGSRRQLLALTDKLAERKAALEEKARDIRATLADLADVEAKCQKALQATMK